MSISADHISRFVRTIWETQLGLELLDADTGEVRSGIAEQNVVDIAARYSGDFNAILVQRCSLQLSLVAASAAFAADREGLDVSDARDALIELANMTAGNLKSVIPGNGEVSIPAPIDRIPSSNPVIAEAGFLRQGEPLIVTIYGIE